jgi:hypothetical protein
VFKWVIKTIFISSSPFAFLIINVKILSNFRRNGAHLVQNKNEFDKSFDCPLLKFKCFQHAIFFLFVSNFEHVNFAINGKYFQKNMAIQVIMLHF